MKSRLIRKDAGKKRKDADGGKDRGQEDKGATENEMVGWHHWLNEHEFEQTPVKDREAWHAVVHGFTKSWTRLSDWQQQITKLRIGIFLSPPSNSNVQSSLRTIVLKQPEIQVLWFPSLRNTALVKSLRLTHFVSSVSISWPFCYIAIIWGLSFQDMLLLLRMFVN